MWGHKEADTTERLIHEAYQSFRAVVRLGFIFLSSPFSFFTQRASIPLMKDKPFIRIFKLFIRNSFKLKN